MVSDMAPDMLAVDVEKRLGTFEVHAAFQGDNGVTALFGPSGSGKTSIVGMIAGLFLMFAGHMEFVPLTAVASLFVLAGMLLFAFIVYRTRIE